MTPADLERAVATALTPDHFYLNRNLTLRIEQRARESLPWEVFRGHLLDGSQTRLVCTFRSWLVFLKPDATEPTLAVRHDPETRQVFVTRSILVYGHEAFDDQGVIQTREVEKWQRELVGTIELDRLTDPSQLHELLEHYLFLAVIGTSRLPITSLESPLPEFTFGRLGYFPGGLVTDGDTPCDDRRALLEQVFFQGPHRLRETKLLELALRALPEDDIPDAVRRRFLPEARGAWALPHVADAIQSLFNHLALSPYTDFVQKLTWFIFRLAGTEGFGPGPALELFSHLLRNLVRHLTAFDLQVFHNRGANYPDALALDLWLRAFCTFIESQPSLSETQANDEPAAGFTKRRLRRALRQAWLVRKQLEGLRVPDHPTSPGENLRVLPKPYGRLTEQQVLRPDQRGRRLFANEPAEALLTPAVRRILERSLDDLEHDSELLELGLAVFLDRPFGVFKQPGEVDRTPLFSYEAFSRSFAMSRLNAWHQLGLLTKANHAARAERLLHTLEIKGISVMDLPGRERPGVVALEDAIRASPDFVVLRATKSTAACFAQLYLDAAARGLPAASVDRWNASRLSPIRSPRVRVCADAEAFITVYNERAEPVVEFGLGQRARGPVRYREWAGVEQLAEGLRVLRCWDEAGREVQPGAPIRIDAS